MLAAIVIIAIPVVLVSLNVRGWRDRIFVRTPRIQALAVLPFENLSNAPGQEYFSDGMTQALITELGKIGGPRVISRHSIMQFKGSKKTLQQISRELSVDAIVEGTVERSGNRVLVTMHLAQVSPERQLWANEYDRGIRDVPGLQGEIARAVAGEIKVRLTQSKKVLWPFAFLWIRKRISNTCRVSTTGARIRKLIYRRQSHILRKPWPRIRIMQPLMQSWH